MTGLSRRRLLQVAAASGATVLLSAASGAAWGSTGPADRLRVYVLVVDGCRPDEISALGTPVLHALRTQGVNYPAASSFPVYETLPNHAMMMTGVVPERTGVPANSIFDVTEQAVRDLDRSTDLWFPTIIEGLNAQGRTTGTVLSKAYLFGLFGERATYRWEPAPLVPITEHAPDAFTVDALISMVDTADPDLVFVNLGDIDRAGHSDLTGTTLQAARRAALTDTDLHVGRFVRHLKDTGRWESSVLMVLADHSMDWSIPTRVISVKSWLDDDQLAEALLGDELEGRSLGDSVTVAQNGGADLIYWTGADKARGKAINRVRDRLLEHPGIDVVRRPHELRLGARAGDLVAMCRPGWRFSDPYIVSNPIPGNHGHVATEPIPFFVTGGSPHVPAATTVSDPVSTLDVAPTIGALFGVPVPAGGYDGKILPAAGGRHRRR